MIASGALVNQERFRNSKTLFITGERSEESANRARYKTFEPHATDRRSGKLKRHVDHWRPIHAWSEAKVWEIIERYHIEPHPAYRLGWGRVSCAACIFGSKNQWASLRKVNPAQFNKVAAYEREFGLTIQRNKNVEELADVGEPYAAISGEMINSATSDIFTLLIKTQKWTLPAGAFAESTGPT